MCSSARVVECSGCDGEGRIYHGDPDTGWSERCPYCEGTGGEVIEALPVDLIDLDEINEQLARIAS